MKAQRIRCTLDLTCLTAPCRGGHVHVPWRAGSKSLIAEEAEYPQLFCQRAAAAIAKSNSCRVGQSFIHCKQQWLLWVVGRWLVAGSRRECCPPSSPG